MKHYRARIPLIVALFMVVVQAILLFSCYGIAVGTREQFAEDSFEIQCYDTKNKVESTFRMLESVIKATENNRVTAYSEGTTATMTEDEIADLSTSVYQYFESLHIPEDMVESVIIISSTYNKSGYIKRIGGNGIVSTVLPNMAQLRLVDMDLWSKDRSVEWFYYQERILEETFKRTLEQNGRNLSAQLKSSVSYFLSLLEGNIVMTARSPYGGSRIFVTVRRDFLNSILNSEEAVNIALLKDGIPVYSSTSYRVYGPQIAEKDAEWSSSVGLLNYNNRSFSLEHASFDLIVNAPVENEAQEMALIAPLLRVALVATAGSVVVSFGLTLLLLNPIRRLTGRFEEQFKNGTYRELGKRRRLLRWPMFYRVLGIMALAVLVPCIVTGFFYRNQLNSFVWDTNARYLEQVSEAVSENVQKKMDYIRFYSALLPEDALVGYLEGEYQSDASLKEKLNSVYTEADMFTGYALFDREGKLRYASRTTHGQQPLNMDELPVDVQSEKQILWEGMAVDNSRDDGKKQPALVHVLCRNVDSQREVVGYMVFYLNMTHFYELRPNVGHEFTVTGPTGEILFSSVSNNSEVYARLAGSQTDQEDEYQLLREPNGILGGEIVTYNDMRYYKEQADRLNYSYLLIFLFTAGLFLVAALMLSRRLSQPLANMVEDMRGMGDIQEITPIHYMRRDEISLLVESYNRMVARMASLIEENAKRINRENELIALNTRTELQMLQQQINPHLLYNTLEFIRYHANAEGKTAAGDMALALADFFRYTTSVKDDIVSFADELNHVKNYIQIHRLRYGERFETVYHVTDEALKCRVVKFILQPFVENVFKYGIANKLHGALITITAYVENDTFYVVLEDNGIGMRPAKFEELQNRVRILLAGGTVDKPGDKNSGGVGMANVARRLHMYYGEQAVLELNSEFMRGFRVMIAIPAEIRVPDGDETTEK